jgi:chitodextrinase
VAGYRVFRNGTQIGGDLGASTLTYSDTTVVGGTTYSYTVKAFDAAGNISAASNTATITVDTTPPTAPGSPSATGVTDSLVKVTWTASTDNVGVTGYQIFRGGAQIGTVGGSTLQYSDSTVAPATSYTYTVKAVDAAGNVSAATASATVTTPLFGDGFETGDFSRWTTSSGLTAQKQTVLSGTWAAESASGPKGNAAYAYKQLPSSQSNLYYEAHVRIISQKTNADLLRLRTGNGTSLVTLFFDGSRKLGYSNDVAGTSTTSSTVLNTSQWYDVRVHVSVSSSLVEVWLDGTKISALSKTENLGSTAIGRVELGESVTGRNFDVAFDDVRADPA